MNIHQDIVFPHCRPVDSKALLHVYSKSHLRMDMQHR